MVPSAPPLIDTGAGVTTVFGRSGAVDAAANDYNFNQIAGQASLVQLPTLGALTVLGSVAGGTPIALSRTQLTALLNPATSSLPGSLPAFPGNTTTFFRGDGAYVTLNCAALSDSGAFCAGTDAANLTGTINNARLASIPNSALANSTITLGSTAMSLGSTYTTIAGAITWSGLQTLAGGLATTNAVQSGYGMFGSATPLTLTAGAIGMSKITASGSAPGAAGGKLELVCGTLSGTAKLVMSGGTSATATTIVDNVGAGVTGC